MFSFARPVRRQAGLSVASSLLPFQPTHCIIDREASGISFARDKHYPLSPVPSHVFVRKRRGDVGKNRLKHYSRGIRQRLYKLALRHGWAEKYAIRIGDRGAPPQAPPQGLPLRLPVAKQNLGTPTRCSGTFCIWSNVWH
jgi:hypothetical protein